MEDQLDKERFECRKCKRSFRHTEGTWLPIRTGTPAFMKILSPPDQEPPRVFEFDTRPPEVITSDKFTCYNCL